MATGRSAVLRRHANAFVTNLNNTIFPLCPELEEKSLIELLRDVGATQSCSSASVKVGTLRPAARGEGQELCLTQ